MMVLSSTGYIQVHAYTSIAQTPLQDVMIAIVDKEGSAIALRMTDRNGKLPAPVEIPVPERAESQAPDPAVRPYATVDLYARLSGYEEIEAKNLQVFSGITSNQALELIPLSELPQYWNQVEIFDSPGQNL